MREQVLQELDFWRPYIFHLNRALGHLKNHEYTAYRGVAVHFDPELYLEGKLVVWHAFSSASVNPTVAKDIMENKKQELGLQVPGTFFVLETKSARVVHAYSHFPDEEEVLFPPNSVFRITRRILPEDKLLLGTSHDVIHLEQVS
eukprot:GGOE01048813.1.p1 GENE.GGOE01048813.1~~GGOE01048813.1.p1  ORF type:complete len:145 (-),score=40.57 GGOE01048813.1:986-1420(-)